MNNTENRIELLAHLFNARQIVIEAVKESGEPVIRMVNRKLDGIIHTIIDPQSISFPEQELMENKQ